MQRSRNHLFPSTKALISLVMLAPTACFCRSHHYKKELYLILKWLKALGYVAIHKEKPAKPRELIVDNVPK
ncbi:AIF_HP2_G0052460.mRNA.1.CDS.1 [Saccharomyces cerevisiae]|nr:AIF_HP2_G0052460.mRNA.1.CDS.1 [Saccharomyces cerevisiae]CAI6798812.1 AIF_HP2_G0052460.mRNA.1.CDS.1 [Saccharomyces cerevisiae]